MLTNNLTSCLILEAPGILENLNDSVRGVLEVYDGECRRL